MPDSNTSPNPEDNKDPVEQTGPLLWVKLLLAFLVAVVAAISQTGISGIGPLLIDPSQFDDPLGVKAATFALCAAAMLSFTMIPTGDRPDEKAVDHLVRLSSLAFAFLSGWHLARKCSWRI